MKDLAEKSGIHICMHRDFELGKTDITIANFHKNSSALDVCIQKLTSPVRMLLAI